MSCTSQLMIRVIVVVLLAGTIMYSEAHGAQANFYVATNGNDAWSGALPAPNAAGTDGPFATLTRARDAIRALKGNGGLRQPLKVLVRGGTYYMPETVTLGPEDSGTASFPITYMAYAGEKPVLSGGRHCPPQRQEAVVQYRGIQERRGCLGGMGGDRCG